MTRCVRTEDSFHDLSEQELAQAVVQFRGPLPAGAKAMFPGANVKQRTMPIESALWFLNPNDFWWHLENDEIRVWVGKPTTEELSQEW